MNLRHAVYAVGAHNGKPCHVYHTVLDDGNGPDLALVPRIALANEGQMAMVDFLDKHVDAGQQMLEHIHRPGLQCLRQDGVVRIGHRIANRSPGFVPLHAHLIQEQAHQLGHHQGRMGIIDMDGNALAELAHIAPGLLVVAHDALHPCRDHEVLLDQAELTALIGAVIGIQIVGDMLHEIAVLCLLAHLLLGQAAIIREITVHLCIPQAQGVHGLVMVAHDRHIIGHSHDRHGILMHQLQGAVLHFLHVGIAVEFDIHSLVCLAVLPGKAVLQPVVRDLHLVAVNELLLEQTVLIADAAAAARQTVRRQGVNEAGSQTAQAAVAKARIRLLLKELRQLQLEIFLQDFLHRILDAEIDQI